MPSRVSSRSGLERLEKQAIVVSDPTLPVIYEAPTLPPIEFQYQCQCRDAGGFIKQRTANDIAWSETHADAGRPIRPCGE